MLMIKLEVTEDILALLNNVQILGLTALISIIDR